MDLRLWLVALVSLGLAACSSTAPSPSPGDGIGADRASVGRTFIEAIARGDLAAAEALEDDVMRGAAPAATLGGLWGQFVAQFGAFQGLGAVTSKDQAPYAVVTIEGRFANATVPLLVAVTADGRVAGLHLGAPVPASSAGTASPRATTSPAAYVRTDAFTETEVTVGTDPWALPGTLSMPAGDGPFPAVVLVAGSGPQDRDETIGPNKPLRDIAWGLASSGIAVLRYDKRTLAHGAEMAAQVADITVQEESVDDAIAAIGLVRETPMIDPGRVFVVGHSLGGYLAPRIAAESQGDIRGIALLEANSTPLPELIVTQSEYLAGLQGSPSPEVSDQLAALRQQVGLAESPDLSRATPASLLPLGVPAAYWLDLRAHDPLATAAGLSIPIFFSQGGRDYQVPPSELEGWRSALAGRDGVTFKVYPTLNHLLIEGSGTSSPAEYQRPGHVAGELVADLAAWVNGQ